MANSETGHLARKSAATTDGKLPPLPCSVTLDTGDGDFVSASSSRKTLRRDYVAVMLVNTTESVSTTLLYPYIGLLIVHLSPGMSRGEAGTYSGLVVAMLQVAAGIFGTTWGRASDHYGRRPLIVLGLIACIVFSLCFGLATSVWQLLLFRFLYGAFNANILLVKTMIPEMSEPGKEATGWAMMNAGWNTGAALGPVFGGLLYDPASRIAAFHGTIFEERPQLLPALACAGYAAVALIVTLLMLPETNTKAMPPRWFAQSRYGTLRQRAVDDAEELHEIGSPDVGSAKESAEGVQDIEIISRGVDRREELELPRPPHQRKYGLREMLSDNAMVRFMYLHIANESCDTVFNEVFPLLAILPVVEGGLGLDSATIGVIFTVFAVETIIGNVVYPIAASRLSLVTTMRLGFWLFGAFTLLHAALPAINWGGNHAHIVAACAALSLFRVFGLTFSYSTSTMGVAACAPRAHLGAATGISSSIAYLVQAVLPPIFTFVFAACVRGHETNNNQGDGPATPPANATFVATVSYNSTLAAGGPQTFWGPAFPFNRWFVFVLLAGFLFSAAFVASTMRERHFSRSEVTLCDGEDTFGELEDASCTDDVDRSSEQATAEVPNGSTSSSSPVAVL
jgi:predicted MFS family arabinose efflux permease